MELFHEIYGCYYHVVGRILNESHDKAISRGEIDHIVAEEGFAESGLHLLPKLLSGEWDLLREQQDGYCSKLEHSDTRLPLTLLEKSWLKALLDDPRIRLFWTEAQITQLETTLQDIQPLFSARDFHLFDVAADGDPYESERYIAHFRLALEAIKQKKPLLAEYQRGKGGNTRITILPQKMLYSQKDDKFRLIGRRLHSRNRQLILNMARIEKLEEAPSPVSSNNIQISAQKKRAVSIAIYAERNALERCMLQFASYDKQTVFDEDLGCHICKISYDAAEETEVLIRILSFGPVLRVLGPETMLSQVRERVRMQIKIAETM